MSADNNQLNADDALLIVDVQNDFCPGGALAIDHGDSIIPTLNQWIEMARAGEVPIYASRDWHPMDHMSFKDQGGLWPPHCIQNTSGAQFHADLILPANTIVVTKGVRFDRDQNSAFADTGLEIHLRRKGIKRLFVGGLALDVCVLATVLDAQKLGFEVMLIKGGTLPVTAEGGQKALEQLKQARIEFIDINATDQLEVCQMAPEWAEHARPNQLEDACDDGRAWEST